MQLAQILRKLSSVLSISFFLLCIAPFVYLSFYTVPNLEDYAESIIPSVWWHVKFLYLTYDGRYFVSFLFAAINPLKIENYLGYQLIPIILFILFYISIISVFRSYLNKVKTTHLALLSALVFILFLHRNPNIPYSFYYMISSYIYFLPSIMFLFLLSTLKKLSNTTSNSGKLLFLSLSIFLIFSISGSNELFLIPILFLLTFFFTYNYVKKKNKNLEFSILLLSMVCAYFIVFTSPGTKEFLNHSVVVKKDITFYLDTFQKTILFSSSHILLWLKENYSLLLAGIIMCLFFLTQTKELITIRESLSNKRFLAAALVYSLAVLLVAFPYCWAAGEKSDPGYTQVFIITYLFFIGGYFALIISFAALISKKHTISKKNFTYLFPMLLIALGLSLSEEKSNIKTAYQDIFSGEAKSYFQEVNLNIHKSKNSSDFVDENNVLSLCTLKHKPSTIYSGIYFKKNDESFHVQYKKFYSIQNLKIIDCQ